jgi:hypothetical protein
VPAGDQRKRSIRPHCTIEVHGRRQADQQSKHDKYRALTQSLRKAYAELPKNVVEVLADIVLGSAKLHNLPNIHAQMGCYIRPDSMRHATNTISDNDLGTAFTHAIESFPLFPLQVTLFIHVAVRPLLQHAGDRALVGVSLGDLPYTLYAAGALPYTLGSLIYPPVRSPSPGRDEGVAFWEQLAPRHLLTTLWNVLVSFYGELFTQAVGASVHDVVDGAFNLNAVPHDLQALAPDGGLEPAS